MRGKNNLLAEEPALKLPYPARLYRARALYFESKVLYMAQSAHFPMAQMCHTTA
jgi:hypothetical protein